MSSSRWVKLLVMFVTLSVFSASTYAGAFGAHGPKRDVITLIVTANYDQPRLLAELIQLETNQPILLLPIKGNGDAYFCPPTSTAAACAWKERDIAKNIQQLSPKQIIVLGDNRYVGEKYLKMFGKEIPVFVVKSGNWTKVALALNPMLNLIRVDKDFARLSAQLKNSQPPVGTVVAPAPMLKTDAGDEVPARGNVPASADKDPELLPDML